jgi:hypothetical protein
VADFAVHLVLGSDRAVSVYAAGTAARRTVKAIAVAPGGGQFDRGGAENLIDALCAATGYRPEPAGRDLDTQRARIRQLGDELRALRAVGPAPVDELAELALARHLGDMVALAADLLVDCADLVGGDRTVAEMVAELALMVEAAQLGTTLTNPADRIAAHHHRIHQLRQQLPPTGDDPNA